MAAWGDEDDDEEQLPTRTEVLDEATGLKTVTDYKLDSAGRKIKTTTQIKIAEVKTRVPKCIAARHARLMARKFGKAKNSDQSNVTIQAHDHVLLGFEEEGASDPANESAKAAMNEFAKKQMWRKLQQKYGMEDGASTMPPPPTDDEEGELGAARRAAAAEGGGGGLAALASGDARSTYVPPSMRGQAGAGVAGSAMARMATTFDDRDQATLRVTNISEDTAEADLQVLFAPYGRIARIYLAKDRDTMVSRGFAFVSYIQRSDAAKAMDALQGHGYDHLILKIEWAKPSAPKPEGEGGLSSGFTSGYGKALAQDTKDKVSYASNLTANR